MPATFYEIDVKAGLKDKRKLSSVIDHFVTEYKKDIKKIKIAYIFCSDDYLLNLNKQFLQHDTLTDILTFNLSKEPNDPNLNAEVYISIDRVKENSKIFNTTYSEELYRVIFHGMLHLCGFNDHNKKEKEEMRRSENTCIEFYKIQ